MYLIVNKLNNQSKSININQLITLCEIGEDYKSFCNDLEILIKSKTNKDLVKDIYNVIQGKFSIRSHKYKAFLEKHKHTIEIMKKYSCLHEFTVLSYNVNGNRNKNLTENYFYEYILKNNENINQIKEVALKIKKLGFAKIHLGENLDFKEFVYNLNTHSVSSFAFLENIEVNSTYLIRPIKYKTNNSCYCMALATNGYGDIKEISKYDREIYLNSLIIDPNTLPNEITVESTISVIQKLADNKKTECSDLRDSIDLSVATHDLKDRFIQLRSLIDNIDKIKNNEDLINLLKEIQNKLFELESFSKNFEKEIIESNTSITDETMEYEKQLYLQRRLMNSIHID